MSSNKQEVSADLEYAYDRVLNSTNLVYLADVVRREIKESTVSELLNADSLAHDMVVEAQQLCRLLHDKLTRHKVYWQNKVALLEATIAELEANK